MCSVTRRVTTSVGPPAAKGTMAVMVLVGYCAKAGAAVSASAASAATLARCMIFIGCFLLIVDLD